MLCFHHLRFVVNFILLIELEAIYLGIISYFSE